MYTNQIKTRVRYSETDQMGYVYYGNYASFYEIGRVETMRKLGSSYRSLEEQGIMMPVYEMQCKYLKPALYDDEITIETTITELKAMRICFEHKIYRDDELLNRGAVTLVFVDKDSNKLCKMPNLLREALDSYF